jgi:hypothetical protein
LNISAIEDRFTKLCDSIPYTERIEESNGPITHRILCITVIEAQLQPCRPWSTKVSVRIYDDSHREIGKTTSIYQSSLTQWKESMYNVYRNNQTIFLVEILHHLDRKKDVVFMQQYFSIDYESLKDGAKEYILPLQNYATLKLKVSILSEIVPTLKATINSICQYRTECIIENLAEQVIHSLVSCHLISEIEFIQFH